MNHPQNQANEPEILPEPIPPEDWECCNSECGELCVYAIYRTQKKAYEQQQAQRQHKS